AAGAQLVLIDVSAQAIAECKIALAAAGHSARLTLVCDVTDENKTAETIAQASQQCGGIDVLHFNVAIAKPGRLPNCTTADFDHMFAVNVRSAVWFCRALLPRMVQAGSGVI